MQDRVLLCVYTDPVPYDQYEKKMLKKARLIAEKKSKELIIFLEHNHVYTTGVSEHKKYNNPQINDVPLFLTQRGGRITYHGPGQRIVYIMMNINRYNRDIRLFVKMIEEWVILSLKKIGINAFKNDTKHGVWTHNKRKTQVKIAFIGLRFYKFISFHGIAINVNVEKKYFNNINPCGIPGCPIASISEIKEGTTKKELDQALISNFQEIFSVPLSPGNAGKEMTEPLDVPKKKCL